MDVEQTRKKLIARGVAEARLSGPRWDLKGVCLTGAKLRGADLRDIDADGTDFSGADLREANFRGASLRRAHFCKSDLRGADFEDAALTATDVTGADLHGVRATPRQLSFVLGLEDAFLDPGTLTDAIQSGYNVHEPRPGALVRET